MARVKNNRFHKEDIGRIAGDGILLKTKGGGETWNYIPINEEWDFHKIDFINDTVGWAY